MKRAASGKDFRRGHAKVDLSVGWRGNVMKRDSEAKLAQGPFAARLAIGRVPNGITIEHKARLIFWLALSGGPTQQAYCPGGILLIIESNVADELCANRGG